MGDKTLEWLDEITLFTLIKHRINNTDWMMKWWWWEGVELGANPNIEKMLNFLDLHLSALEEKALSRICASKTRRNLQTFGRCLQFKQSCPWASLSYFCTLKTSREINAMGRVVLRENVSEKLDPGDGWNPMMCCWARLQVIVDQLSPTLLTPSPPPPHTQGLRLLLIPRPLSPFCLSLRTQP